MERVQLRRDEKNRFLRLACLSNCPPRRVVGDYVLRGGYFHRFLGQHELLNMAKMKNISL